MALLSNGTPSNGALNRVKGETYEDTTIVLDYTEYKNCTFTNCRLLYHGNGATGLVGCTFKRCDWEFAGAAGRTMTFLAGMHSHGGGMREIVEQTIDNIRQ